MIGFKEVAEVSIRRFADSPLGKLSEGKTFDKPLSEYDKPLAIYSSDSMQFYPRDNGEWSGESGNSDWHPDKDYTPLPKTERIPPYNNPDNKTWEEILDKYDIDGITFKDGEPDFSEVSKGDVEIEPFTDSRTDNFDKADIELAKEKGCSPEEVNQWRKENGYTWHECKDMKTMLKVPHEIHANIPHSGGISEIKKGNGDNK